MSFDTAGRTMMGVTGAGMGRGLQGLGLAALGANCGNNLADTEAAVAALGTAALGTAAAGTAALGTAALGTAAVIAAKPNAGVPVWSGDDLVYDGTPEVMAACAHRMRAAGVGIIGACCGSTPAHVAKIAAVLRGDEPVPDAAAPVPEAVPTPGADGRPGRRRRRRRRR